MVKAESSVVAAVGSLNRLLQFGWEEHADLRSQLGGEGKERQNEIKRDITKKTSHAENNGSKITMTEQSFMSYQFERTSI